MPTAPPPRDWLLVVCSLEAWDEVERRLQLMVRTVLALRPEVHVLFVEPALDVPHQVRRGEVRWPRRRRVSPEPRLEVLRPLKWWPRALGPFADRSLARQVAAEARALRRGAGIAAPPVAWVNDSNYAHLVRTTRWPSLYDVTDDWTQAGLAPRELRRVVAADAELTQRCDEVVVCSEVLAATHGERRPVHVVGNGVDVAAFSRPRPRPADLPPAPVALYVGTLHHDRLDTELCADLARARPDVSVVLVGPDRLDGAGAALRALPNVHLLGSRPHAEVPAYLQHADVVVVPHVVSPFTESLDPIKAYECLAVGRPTVATEVAGFRGRPAPVRAVPREQFVAAVVAALAEGGPAAPQPVPTWRDRTEELLVLLDAVRTRAR